MQDQNGRRRSSLSMLVPGALEATSHDRIRQLMVSSIVANPSQVRTSFSEESIQELARSINENGLLEPIIVRPKGGEGTDSDPVSYELVAGERRWRAFKFLRKPMIPAIIRPTKDDDMRLIALLENVQREDLSMLEKAAAVKELKSQLGSVDAVTERVGWSKALTYRLIRIAEADPLYQDAIAKHGLDYRKSDALLSAVEKIKKGGDKNALDTFNRDLLSGPIEQLNELFTQTKISVNTGPRAKGITKGAKRGFWTNKNEFGLSIKVNKQKQLEKRDLDSLQSHLVRFCKELGAKKADIKF